MCFHPNTSPFVLPLEDAKRGLLLLKEAGTRKINFSGGEPFLKADMLGQMVKYCKDELQMESVSIISNGSLIRDNWMEKWGEYLDILAVSCDSFDAQTNYELGRGRDQEGNAHRVAELCRAYNVKFKLNTTVTALNFEEDMASDILELQPVRWKIFQVLVMEQNPQAGKFAVTKEQFDAFCERHVTPRMKEDGIHVVAEDNATMRDTYWIVDEEFRFLNCDANSKIPTDSILDVGVAEAAKQVNGFDIEAFSRRGGIYDHYWGRDIEDLGENRILQ